jgi:MFS family permease
MAFAFPMPACDPPVSSVSSVSDGLRRAVASLGDWHIGAGVWLTGLAGMAFGLVDVLGPLRLSALGASALVIGATYLGSAAIEAGLSPLAGRLSDRRGALVPVRILLAWGAVASLAAPLAGQAAWLVVVLVAACRPMARSVPRRRHC